MDHTCADVCAATVLETGQEAEAGHAGRVSARQRGESTARGEWGANAGALKAGNYGQEGRKRACKIIAIPVTTSQAVCVEPRPL